MWKTVLAFMLFLMPPGKSPYSLVVVDRDAPRPCDQIYSPLCRAPFYSRHHDAWVTVETYQTGLLRYRTIAEAITELAYDPERDYDCPAGRLSKLLLTVAFHESGFRRDVHSGIGPDALGDCRYRKVDGEMVKIAGSCRSHCLAQLLFPSDKRRKVGGYSRGEVIGTDKDSTRRCFEVAAGALAHFDDKCGRRLSCTFGRYGGVTVPSRHAGVKARVRTYWRLRQAPTKLDEKVLRILKGDQK